MLGIVMDDLIVGGGLWVSRSRIRRPYEKFGDASEEAGCVGKVVDYVYEELHGKLMEILEKADPFRGE
jgi:hypothetical protein